MDREEQAARIKWFRRAGWALFILALAWALLAPRFSDAGPLDLFLAPLIVTIVGGVLMSAGDIAKLLDMLKK